MNTLNDLTKLADISRVNHLNKFYLIGIPKNQVILGGSAVMALFGIRSNKDIDAIVTKKIWNKLEKYESFKSKMANKDRESSKYYYHIFAPSITLFGIDYPLGYTAEEALKDKNISFEFEGFHFETLEHLIKWKKEMRREKDLFDITLIRKFLKNSKEWIKNL